MKSDEGKRIWLVERRWFRTGIVCTFIGAPGEDDMPERVVDATELDRLEERLADYSEALNPLAEIYQEQEARVRELTSAIEEHRQDAIEGEYQSPARDGILWAALNTPVEDSRT